MLVPGNLATRVGLEVPTKIGYAEVAEAERCEEDASVEPAEGTTDMRVGRLYGPVLFEARLIGRPAVDPKSIADELAALSISRLPYEARFAEGDDGEAGDPLIKLRRFAGGRAEGTTGDSQKNDPSPGDPEKEDAPENAGEAVAPERRRVVSRGESISMSESVALLGERDLGSVYRVSQTHEADVAGLALTSHRAKAGLNVNLGRLVSSLDEDHFIGIPPLGLLTSTLPSGSAGGPMFPL